MRKTAALAVGAALATSLAVSAPGASAASASPHVGVVVREQAGAGHGPEGIVRRLGGRVVRQLGVIGGFSALVPGDRVASLQRAAGVAAVTPDAGVRLSSVVDGYDAVPDTGSMYNSNHLIKAQDAWGRGISGRGVDVAIIDSGVAPVKGLDAPGKVVHGPDLSFDSQDESRTQTDGFGHGTHMAGIIAGRDDADFVTPAAREDRFYGVAPDARLVSLKVADANGAADVSQLIAAIDWVVQNRTRHGLNIRVLNLSFGTESAQGYELDPLSYAAEVAWQKGIVVVVAAGNDGTGTGKLNNPAYNPFVLAVGADDTRGTNSISDDVIPDFSSKGDGVRNPDLVAPGRSIQSLRVAGSAIDTAHPSGRINSRFFRGSGTSQAAAFVSGAAALVLSDRPTMTPDQVKHVLTASATKLPAADAKAQGAGLVDIRRAAGENAGKAKAQMWKKAVGVGTLDAARGGSYLVDNATGIELRGNVDIFGKAFDSQRWAADSLAGTTWTGGTWNGSEWTGVNWTGVRWSGVRWSSNAWSGSTWSGVRWSGVRWSGVRWSGVRWSGVRWSDAGWN